jgi:flagellar protein FlgJ
MQTRADIYTDFQAFSGLRRDAQESNPEAIKQVAKQFESLFVQMMLKSMRETLPEGGLFDSQAGRMYRDMFDKQLSLNIANGRGVGLAAVIERQLSKQAGLNQADDKAQSALPLRDNLMSVQGAQSFPLLRADSVSAAENFSQQTNAPWQTPDEFVAELWPHAVRAGNQLGVVPDVLVAQSVLETGWGQHLRNKADGSPSYALFGIKADSRWQGERINVSTLEFRNGAMQREQAPFRAYSSVAEAFDDYVNFIESNPRYLEALQRGYDPDAYARGLQQAGYATDPDYAEKIGRIRQSDAMQLKISEFKLEPNQPIS